MSGGGNTATGGPEDSDRLHETDDPRPGLMSLQEAESPKRGLIHFPQKPDEHPDRVRLFIVRWTIWLILLMSAAGTVGWFMGKDLRDFLVIYTPVFTLAGTSLGFYFSDRRKKR